MEDQDYGELIEDSAFSLFEIEEETSLFDDNYSIETLVETIHKPTLISLPNRDTKLSEVLEFFTQ